MAYNYGGMTGPGGMAAPIPHMQTMPTFTGGPSLGLYFGSTGMETWKVLLYVCVAPIVLIMVLCACGCCSCSPKKQRGPRPPPPGYGPMPGYGGPPPPGMMPPNGQMPQQ